MVTTRTTSKSSEESLASCWCVISPQETTRFMSKVFFTHLILYTFCGYKNSINLNIRIIRAVRNVRNLFPVKTICRISKKITGRRPQRVSIIHFIWFEFSYKGKRSILQAKNELFKKKIANASAFYDNKSQLFRKIFRPKNVYSLQQVLNDH